MNLVRLVRFAAPGSLAFRSWYVQQRNRKRRQAGGEEPDPSNGLLTGLVGYYALNEGSATDNALDSSSNVRDLTQTNSPQVASGKLSGCRTFNGATNSRRFTSTDVGFDIANDFTFAGWARHSTVGTNQPYFSKHDTTLNQRSYKLRCTNTLTWTLVASTNGTSETMVTFNAITAITGQWYFFCARRTGSTLKLSITPDNEGTVRADVTATLSGALFASSAPFALGIGLANAVPLDLMVGDLDEIGIWNAHLDDTQVGLLFGAGTPPGFASFS